MTDVRDSLREAERSRGYRLMPPAYFNARKAHHTLPAPVAAVAATLGTFPFQ
ncbi:hypothetical protein XTPLMG728_0391 [Xanthomonas translucens pv. poae]|uniref:Uncharacterized protein n=1 Tax=Xanthomonas graminis pv. poae TaxID=227946 RepID=A0A0K2ZGA8_9XANT|nr:hypothetical protein XTPLMG728_0391 [Xanthomonas translucens pv. poae]